MTRIRDFPSPTTIVLLSIERQVSKVISAVSNRPAYEKSTSSVTVNEPLPIREKANVRSSLLSDSISYAIEMSIITVSSRSFDLLASTRASYSQPVFWSWPLIHDTGWPNEFLLISVPSCLRGLEN